HAALAQPGDEAEVAQHGRFLYAGGLAGRRRNCGRGGGSGRGLGQGNVILGLAQVGALGWRLAGHDVLSMRQRIRAFSSMLRRPASRKGGKKELAWQENACWIRATSLLRPLGLFWAEQV